MPAASAPAPAPTPAPASAPTPASAPAAATELHGSASTGGVPAAPRGLRSRWAALGVLSTGMLMTVLDGSIVTVAMPAIQDDLGFTPPDSAGSSTPT